MPKSFVLNTDDVNSYGFRTLTAGIVTPVSGKIIMLWNHVRANGTDKNQILPIGHWVNLRKVDGQLLGDAEFDMGDPFAADIARKVEAGHLFEASAGLKPVRWDLTAKLNDKTLPTLAESKIREASICDIASNDNAVALYDDNDQVIDLTDKTALINLTSAADTTTFSNTNNMEELKIIGGLLGLSASCTLSDVQGKINTLLSLNSENEALKAQIKLIEDKQKAEQKAEMVKLLDAAVQANQITQAQRPVYETLFDKDFESTKAILSGLPKTVKLSEFAAGGGKDEKGFTYNGMTFSEMQRKNSAALATLKANDFTTFNQLYKAEFGKDYKIDKD